MADLSNKTGSTTWKKSDSLVCRNIAEETILVPIQRNLGDVECIYTLSGSGARIWELLDGKTSLQKVKEILIAEFDAPQDTIEEDLHSFLDQLQEIKAITADATGKESGGGGERFLLNDGVAP